MMKKTEESNGRCSESDGGGDATAINSRPRIGDWWGCNCNKPLFHGEFLAPLDQLAFNYVG
jgi:hypothetical protein